MPVARAALDRLKAAAGPGGFSENPSEIAPHLVEWRSRYRGTTPLLLKPASTAEVSALLAICNETNTPIVPQGGNTGLVGGQVPLAGEVLLSLERMNKIRRINGEDMSAIAEAGVILARLQDAADQAGVYFPLSLASEGSATIGGNISTNAGGVNVLRYGSARQLVLGLEVVLADGRVLDLLKTLHKDNTGYDLKQLFIGAEGTLGIITAAALKLFPRPQLRETAFVAVRNPAAAIALLRRLEAATGGLVSAFELMSRTGIDLVLGHIPDMRDPLSGSSPWYVLAEATSGAALPLRKIVEDTLAGAVEDGLAGDATLAANEAQRAALWKLRESFSEAQKLEGASIKHDVSVPIQSIPDFLARGCAAVEAMIPGVRPVPFGHLGDGNIHFNFSVPKGGDNAEFLGRWDEVSRTVHDLANSFGGAISAEHGLGIMKRDEITRYKSAAELEIMRALKRTLDPNNILNPGKVVRV
ncbi:MAG TPA: FAD-binding oxidoreductase [Rhizomicrobium sp.]|jgi:FAD/FMN-containing dehydrogenase|nr:FAD-binding oxidoreductase [Rhizomicrobium sp.]